MQTRDSQMNQDDALIAARNTRQNVATAVAAHDRCSMQYAQNAVRKHRYHSNQQEKNLFSATTASERAELNTPSF